MKKSTLYILIILIAFSAPAEVIFNSDAALTHIQEKFRKGVKITGSGLAVEANTASVRFNSMPLEARTKYKLTLRAYTDRPDCIENNDMALEFARTSRGKVYPEYAINCLDGEGKPRTLMLYSKIKIGYSAPVVSRSAADYIYVFYTPDGATDMQLELRPNRNRLFVERFNLEKESGEDTINPNPDFRYGPLNPCGWAAQTRFFRTPDGKTVAQCGYYNGSPFFLLDEKGSYSYYCKGVEAGPGKATIVVSFFDVNGVKTGTTHLFHGPEVKGGAVKAGLNPPPGTFQAQVIVTNMILSDWRVTRD